MNLKYILQKFITQPGISSITPYGTGHINDTYLVTLEGAEYNYILQRINNHIFKDVPGLMQNIITVTSHLKKKLQEMPGHDPSRETLNLLQDIQGHSFIRDEEGNFWRVFLFIPGMKIYENALNPGIAFEAGRIIGFFQYLLTDLDQEVKDTLPGFHSILRRSKEFHQALGKNLSNRAGMIKDDIFFVMDRMTLMQDYFISFEKKGIPKRIVHYDTKLNNILFDLNDKAACLIDLDTLCPGYVHFDYGDALRTLANTSCEDEKDLEKVRFNVPFYESFTRGYISEADRFLTTEEKHMLPFAPVYLTFIIGLRFLTDYLNGDTYYKISYPEHNLVRARVQFRLVEEMERIIQP